MPDLSQRSLQPELLDRDDLPFADIQQNMRELDFINTWLGGHQITLAGVAQLLCNNHTTPAHICEIGCGGGDNLRVIKHWCAQKRIPARFTGIDINPHCIAFAQSRAENTGIDFLCSDYRTATLQQQPDIIFSSLFCHHFTDEALVAQFSWMHRNSNIGFFINDLQRHPLAYYSIKWLTRLFSRSYLVKNDAPLSVWRGFFKQELLELLQQSVPGSVSVTWKWAFRWLIVYKHA